MHPAKSDSVLKCMLVVMDLFLWLPDAAHWFTAILIVLAVRGVAALRHDVLQHCRTEPTCPEVTVPPPPVPPPTPAPVRSPEPTTILGGAVVRQTIRRNVYPQTIWVPSTGQRYHLDLTCQYVQNRRGRRELTLCDVCNRVHSQVQSNQTTVE